MRRPALIALAACFFISALTRLGDPDGAMAYEVQRLARQEADAENRPLDAAEIDRLLAAIRERETELEARALKMAEREKVIEAAETRLRDQMKSMEAAEGRLSELVRMARTASKRDIDKLVATYGAMGGKRAGPIFETMDDAFAAGLLSRMDDAQAAGILAAMTPEKAYAVTVHIAGQNARAPGR